MNDFHFTQLLNPEFYITLKIGGIQLGLYIVLFIVFAETGLFAGFFLPGDSLLFLSGIYSRDLIQNFILLESDFLNVVFFIALGVVYFYGRKVRMDPVMASTWMTAALVVVAT